VEQHGASRRHFHLRRIASVLQSRAALQQLLFKRIPLLYGIRQDRFCQLMQPQIQRVQHDAWRIRCIVLDPLDLRLHQLAEPILANAVEQRDALEEQLLQRGTALENAGYPAQVK